MNEEPTRDFPDKLSFEDRVFARFDAVDARLEKLESRSYDTKPIWEKALKAILETGLDLGEVRKKIDVIENRVGVLETEVACIRTDSGAMRDEFLDLKRELVRQLTRRLDLVLKTMVDHRDDLRDAEERITQLEAKLA